MTALGFSLQAKHDCSLTQAVEMLCDVGFSAISPVWSPELPLEDLTASVARLGMTIQSVHAPHRGQPILWDPKDPTRDAVRQQFLDCIDTCDRFGVPMAVLHGWQGLGYTFPETPLDFSAFDRIVDYAEERNVSIAFENLEGEEYLAALLDRYRDRSHVGYCWIPVTIIATPTRWIF